jgi:hypothetical protein
MVQYVQTKNVTIDSGSTSMMKKRKPLRASNAIAANTNDRDSFILGQTAER